jgi:hypothetical protein
LVRHRELHLDRRIPLAEFGERGNPLQRRLGRNRSPAVPAPANNASVFRSLSRTWGSVDMDRPQL